MISSDYRQVWAVSDGRAGNARQATALADALDPGRWQERVVAPRAPWRWIAPRVLPGSAMAIAPLLDEATAAPPGLAVGCGRQAALATRLLGAPRGRIRTVQILDPRVDPVHWDLVVVPDHDPLRGANVLTMLGSLHPVDDAWLDGARATFADLAALPRPRTALLLGGASAHLRFDRPSFDALAALLGSAVDRDGGSILATTSRRSPPWLAAALRTRFGALPGRIWTGMADGPNPYPGLLAWADRIVCTPDSVNMVSEACATRVPVHVWEPGRVHGRPRRFLEALLQRGRIRATDAVLPPFAVEPLRETARIALEVRERLHL